MTTDIISRADCAGDPSTVWRALLRAAHVDPGGRTGTLPHADLRVRSLSPGVGLRGRARWGDVRYRVTAYLVPHDERTRLLLVAAVDLASAPSRAAVLRNSRRLATQDLRELSVATAAEAERSVELRESA